MSHETSLAISKGLGNDHAAAMIEAAGPEYRRLESFKSFLVDIGSHCSRRTLHFITSTVSYIEVGHWMKSHGFHTVNRFAKRRELFHLIAGQVGESQVLYLEFGVAKGASMRYWSELLTNPNSTLHGFDTFEGLPEEWRVADKGAYSAGGRIPACTDPRVCFYKGMFQQTLPAYHLPKHESLIINIDCDLYSSTKFVLTMLSDHIQKGTFIYFDEFSDPRNELRAFQEYLDTSNKRFVLVACTRAFGQCVFQCL
jgi:hypothetical protein